MIQLRKESITVNPHSDNTASLHQPMLPQAISAGGVNGNLPDDHLQQEDAEQFAYHPVPPRKTVAISVRCLVRGRGRPLPFSLDEGDGE
jgi:hypothetical protein